MTTFPTQPLSPGDLVRIQPNGKRSGSGNWPRGRVVEVGRRRARVRPFGHGHDEWIDMRYVRVWKARNG